MRGKPATGNLSSNSNFAPSCSPSSALSIHLAHNNSTTTSITERMDARTNVAGRLLKKKKDSQED